MVRSHQVAARGWQSKRRAESTGCKALRVSEVRHINQIRWLRTREVNSTRNLELFSFSGNNLEAFDRGKQEAGSGLDVTENSVFVDQVVWIVQVPQLLE